MERVGWDGEAATAAAVADRVEPAVASGGVVLVPTDTVYGLAVVAAQADAIARLFRIKGRDRSKPIAVLVADRDQGLDLMDRPGDRIVEWTLAHWPGALTVVARRRRTWDVDLGGDPSTVGVRCPDSALVRELARRVGPLAVTSANPSGEPTPPTADEIGALLAGSGVAIDVVVDAGPVTGRPSTVVDATSDPPRVLRVGDVVVPGGAAPAPGIDARSPGAGGREIRRSD